LEKDLPAYLLRPPVVEEDEALQEEQEVELVLQLPLRLPKMTMNSRLAVPRLLVELQGTEASLQMRKLQDREAPKPCLPPTPEQADHPPTSYR
jgi:hypothetical protein